jgi:hypothetical protein
LKRLKTIEITGGKMKLLLLTILFTGAVFSAYLLNYTSLKNSRTAESETRSEESNLAKSETYGKIPLSFERNDGQTDSQVKFLSRGAGYALFLTEREAVMRLRNGECEKRDAGKFKNKRTDCRETSSVLRMQFDGAKEKPQISGAGEQEAKSNYLNLDGTGERITNVSNFERVNYKEIYDGIDLVFYGNERELEYDFNVAPNADAARIKLKFDGAKTVSVDEAGNLNVAVANGKTAQFKAPVAYQMIDGERRAVAANYSIEEKAVRFQIGDYDESQTLTIDPILQYSSYFGGSSDDDTYAIAVNGLGELYIAGETYSSDFPIANAIQSHFSGSPVGFLTKFNSSGTGVIFSTYLGGSLGDIADIALDAGNNISFTGFVLDRYDVSVGKLNSSGTAFIYPTLVFGGSEEERPTGIALDAGGNAYICGWTLSSDFPTTPGVVQRNNGPGGGSYAARVNTNGTLDYATYLDGAGNDYANDIAVDSSGNVYIVGQRSLTINDGDGFILKLNPFGSALAYPTYYIGGSGYDSVYTVKIDGSGNAYVGGSTGSTNFPTTAGVVQPNYGGGTEDGFVAKVNSSGNALVWSTYLGAIASENVTALQLDSSGKIYVTGKTTITNDENFYVVHLNQAATVIDYNAQFGGSAADSSRRLTLDGGGNIYITGVTASADYPTTPYAFDRGYNGQSDIFIMKINAPAPPPGPVAEIYNVNVPGNAIAGLEKTAAEVYPGDQVTIDNITGTVIFNPSTTCHQQTYYSVNGYGLDRSIYEDSHNAPCYSSDRICTDPLVGFNDGHAGLYLVRDGLKTFIGAGGTTFTATAYQLLYFGINDCSGANSYTPNSGSFDARVTIRRANPPELTLNVSSPSLQEGNLGTSYAMFEISLPYNSQTVTVRYQTADGTAKAGSDYGPTSGTLTFFPYETLKKVSVPVKGDTAVEANEYFTLQLINPVNAQTVVPRGRATIINDDTN